MALTSTARIRAAGTGDVHVKSKSRSRGIGLAVAGLALAMIAVVANLGVANQVANGSEVGGTLAWSFGLTTLAFGTVKLGIASILVGIAVRLHMRVAATKRALLHLVADVGRAREPLGELDTAFGRAIATSDAPPALPIHRMAQTMWPPMLAMGAMSLFAGFLVSLSWASSASLTALAWTHGLQFLGEGLLLSGISFLLGTILAGLRSGGAEVQTALGVSVKTLKMPNTAKAFVALMMAGLMASVGQFLAYIALASSGGLDAAALAWLGPLRELALGLLLAGIVLALATIAKALGFQFDRIGQLIKNGR